MNIINKSSTQILQKFQLQDSEYLNKFCFPQNDNNLHVSTYNLLVLTD